MLTKSKQSVWKEIPNKIRCVSILGSKWEGSNPVQSCMGKSRNPKLSVSVYTLVNNIYVHFHKYYNSNALFQGRDRKWAIITGVVNWLFGWILSPNSINPMARTPSIIFWISPRICPHLMTPQDCWQSSRMCFPHRHQRLLPLHPLKGNTPRTTQRCRPRAG